MRKKGITGFMGQGLFQSATTMKKAILIEEIMQNIYNFVLFLEIYIYITCVCVNRQILLFKDT